MSGPIMIEDVVCPHCADLCDDLRLTIEGNRITAVEVECPAARAFFLGYQVEGVTPKVRGAGAEWGSAVEEAARILGCAVSPLVVGLSTTACDAQRVAVMLPKQTESPLLADPLSARLGQGSTGEKLLGPTGRSR